MINRSWILTGLVGMILIYESAALTCIKCADTDSSQNCTLGATLARQATPCDVDDTHCYMRNNNGKIERGCMKELAAADQAACQTASGASCVSCTGDNCNSDPWLRCHQCDSADATCTGAQDSTGGNVCPNFAKPDQCYAKVDDVKVTRGCQSSLQPADVTECTGNKNCEFCSGNGCNNLSGDALKVFPKCIKCTSMEPNCENATKTAEECDRHDDVCYTRVQDKILHRGCLSTLIEADRTTCQTTEGTSCITCSGEESCNKVSWLKCHQCSETALPTCAELQTPEKAEFCSIYKGGNRCYERLESSKMARGCETDLTTADNPCKDNRECRECTENGCNKEAASTLQNQDRCLQCSTGSTDATKSCLLGTAVGQPCAAVSDKSCYSKVDADGVLKRGCQGDLNANEITACTGKTCNICTGEDCNKNVFPTDRLRCYQCKSTDADKSCSEQLTGEPKSSHCTLYNAADKCYSRLVDGVFERGCQSDLKAAACEGLTEKQCQSCATENCNGISENKLKNSAGQKAVSSVLLAAVVALVVFK